VQKLSGIVCTNIKDCKRSNVIRKQLVSLILKFHYLKPMVSVLKTTCECSVTVTRRILVFDGTKPSTCTLNPTLYSFNTLMEC